jgi:hypothetical protein
MIDFEIASVIELPAASPLRWRSWSTLDSTRWRFGADPSRASRHAPCVIDDRHGERDKRASRVAALAGRQWGNITSAQLRACGVTRASAARWCDKGVLHRRHFAVYAFGAPSPAPEAQWTAALLAVGDGAHLTRLAALALYDLWTAPRVTEVAAPKHRRGDETLRVRITERPEQRRRRGIPVTTLPRTFLDLAADHFPIDRPVHEAAARRLVKLKALRAYAEANAGRPGAKALLHAATNPHYRSMTERDLHARLAARGVIADPNAPIDGMTVDLILPDHNLVIEIDTEQTHGTAHAARTDARRDERLKRRGLDVLRVDAS